MEMQAKTTVTCHYALTGMVKIKKKVRVIAHTNKNVKQLKLSYTAVRNSKYRHSGKQFLMKLTGIYPAIPLMYLPLMKLIFT